mgnify:CR=1 FL=1
MQLVAILQGMLTPVIALAVAYIAWQQWKLSREKLLLDLYDRRIETYREVRKILAHVLTHGRADNQTMLEFYSAVSQADFLFGKDVNDYNQLIYENGLQLAHLNGCYSRGIKGQVPNYDNKKTVEEQHELLRWFTEQYEPAKVLYGRYLKIEHSRHIG